MTADMDPVISAARVFGDERFAEGEVTGAASRQAEVDALTQRAVEQEAALAAVRAEYAAHMQTHVTPPPPDPDPEPEPEPVRTVTLGMSAPADIWAQRLREVGPEGITARRIFADLVSNGRNQSRLIEEAVAAGMTPVVSYKGTPTATNLAATAAYLQSLGVTVLATYWHEPWGDFTDYAIFRANSSAFLDAVSSDRVKVGPFLNGWLLNKRVADFKSLTDPSLLRDWDFMGIDTYEEGTIEAPGAIKPASRIPLLAKFCRDNGIPDKPLCVGEYNGYSAESIRAAGEAILSEPNMWVACMWNSTTGKGHALTGDRLAAFKATKADSRVKR